MRSALILFAHGSRDPEWAAPFLKIRKSLAERRPDLAVELAFLESMQPALDEAAGRLVAAGHDHIVIAPLFMAQGGHLRRDLPRLVEALRQRHRGVTFTLLPAAGDADPVLDAICGWLAAVAAR